MSSSNTNLTPHQLSAKWSKESHEKRQAERKVDPGKWRRDRNERKEHVNDLKQKHSMRQQSGLSGSSSGQLKLERSPSPALSSVPIRSTPPIKHESRPKSESPHPPRSSRRSSPLERLSPLPPAMSYASPALASSYSVAGPVHRTTTPLNLNPTRPGPIQELNQTRRLAQKKGDDTKRSPEERGLQRLDEQTRRDLGY